MPDDKFEVNLMRMIVAELYYLAGMQTAREMYAKSYFALGGAEKAIVDQTVVANIGGNYQLITPEALKAQATQPAVGFQAQAAQPKAGS